MIIFLSMLIPFFTALVLWIKFRHQTKWWEFCIPFAASLLLSSFFFFIAALVRPTQNEFWTTYITSADYYESWNEKVHYTERVADGTTRYRGADGKYHTRTKYKTVHKTRIDEHPAYWKATDNIGQTFNINQETYKDFIRRWGKERFTELNRNFYTKDGNRYTVNFNDKDADIEVVSTLHSYENRVAVSKSVFNFEKVLPEQVKSLELVEFPKIQNRWDAPSILGARVPGVEDADRELCIFNARYGADKQVRVWIILFKNQSLDAGYMQQNYWKNGNFNDFVICIGVNSENVVQWGYAFSWTNNSMLSVDIRNRINEKKDTKLDFAPTLAWIKEQIPAGWTRKDFKKDFRYISLSPPTWMIVVSFLFTIALNVGLSMWIVQNEFDETKRRW